ncbi:hypothetical protein HUN08_09600 [Gordonia sp. X0973]|uniref:hypothetical protein n=1 Tax=Gordonia sp. X0973 TaxID=2742602 RepID=UPI000F536CDA|nr:hypothetical protein [Gordonia sp. X0973]QKT07419.1 hypothetical protein HUN08_09600 [Gordonia sp. X0973]
MSARPGSIRSAVVIPASDPDAAVVAYESLLGGGSPLPADAAGRQWQIGSTRVVVRPGADQPRLLVPAADLVDPQAPDVFESAVKLLGRRSCAVTPADLIGTTRAGAAADLPIGVVDAPAVEPLSTDGAVDDVTGLDHVVMHGDSRDAALACFGAGFGFDFRLEQRLGVPDQGEVHQLFLRGAGTILEVLISSAGAGLALWGLAWTSGDIDASHARLADGGADLSPIRDGRKPGTRVFTIRGAGLVVPTIVIGHDRGRPG